VFGRAPEQRHNLHFFRRQLDTDTTRDKNITYANRGGFALPSDLYIPEWSLPTKKPGVLVAIHGGGWGECDQRRDAIMNSLMDMAAKANTTVFNIEYRLENEGGRYPSNVMDVKCSVQFIKGWALANPRGRPDTNRGGGRVGRCSPVADACVDERPRGPEPSLHVPKRA